MDEIEATLVLLDLRTLHHLIVLVIEDLEPHLVILCSLWLIASLKEQAKVRLLRVDRLVDRSRGIPSTLRTEVIG